jgi:hypothetical protein
VPRQKYDDSRPGIPAEVARAVQVEAGHKCAIKECPEHTYVEIHHINENREDNQTENLILLCDKHHKMAHAGKIDRKALHEYKKLLRINDSGTLLKRLEKLESLLAAAGLLSLNSAAANKAINLVLEEALLLGNKLWGTNKGNELAQQIYSLIRKHGNQMSVDSVDLMVIRSESYSRTGLVGLAILYDEFFEHAKSLNLIDHFEAEGLREVAYYCALREHFPQERDISACLRSTEFKWGGFRVACDADFLMAKYPNRGPSIVLEYLSHENGDNDA